MKMFGLREPTLEEEVCEAMVARARKDWKVRRLVESIEKLGCVVPKSFFSCELCKQDDVLGGFIPSNTVDNKGSSGSNTSVSKVLLCADVVSKYKIPQEMVTQTLVHELIHAYDACRAHVNWNDCSHIACSEVRAANLSGDCSWRNEVNRGNMEFEGQGKKCMQRRAEMSVASHKQCTEKAQLYVDAVFDRCSADIAPFMNR